MNIQLQNWVVKSIQLQAKELDVRMIDNIQEEEKSNKFSFSYGSGVNEKTHRTFQVAFKINVENVRYSLSAEVLYNFVTSEEFDDKFKSSSFININAPAIAFPYLRSFVSFLTMHAGYPAVMLPSINFVAMAKAKD